MSLSELEEAKWLITNPDFNLRPANIREFCGRGYMNERNVRPGVMNALVETFGDHVNSYSISPIQSAVMTGGIGIGKSTYAAISLSYMVHWVKCLRNPKEFFNLSEDSIIGFMMMSTSEKQAREVIFQKVKKRVENSVWFQQYSVLQKDHKRLQKQMRFEGDIWIVPGTSLETSFEGYDILAGIVDEGDSHRVTDTKSYADDGFNTIESRIESRFMDFKTGKHRGLIIVIGQAKSKSGFILKKFRQFEADSSAVAHRMTIWESFGWHNFTKDPKDIDRGIETAERNSFFYDQRKRQILSKESAALVMNKDLIEVPMAYIKSFENDPVKALRDLAGIPPEVEDPFIPQADRILDCQEKWHERFGGEESPVRGNQYNLGQIILPPGYHLRVCSDEYPRVLHVDTAISGRGDSLGFAMGHIPEKIIRYDQERPLILFDILMRVRARPGRQIDLDEVRKFIYTLRDEYKFNIDIVTLDGFNSVDFIQMLRKNQVKSDYLSIDKVKGPYEDLREAVNARRCLHPAYMVEYIYNDTQLTNIAYKELSELSDVGTKIDHPKGGSKDVSDAMAGVVHVLVNNSKYMREARSIEEDGNTVTAGIDLNSLFKDDNKSGLAVPVSFDEFVKNQQKYLQESTESLTSVDFNLLTRGDGPLGFPIQQDRVL